MPLKKLFSGKLARASTWLFLGVIISGMFGYVFQILMGRMLSTHDYALFSAIMAVFAFLSAPLGALMMSVSRKVSEYNAHQDFGSLKHFFYSIQFKMGLIGILLFILCLPFMEQLQNYLKAESVVSIWLLLAMLLLCFPPVINNTLEPHQLHRRLLHTTNE